tara:strand:- start:1381 stop:2055 length:675 start_codon:yes stop_codon:yes gene_type:complete
MNLEKNIKGLCSKNGIHFQDFLSDLGVEHVHELSVFDLEAICEEYEIPMQTLMFKSIAMETDLLNKIQKIKLIILDVDGVMTDGGMTFTANGDEQKKFNTKDGMGILQSVKKGLEIGIISSGFSDQIVKKRAEMLGITNCYVGGDAKIEVLDQWIQEKNLSYDEVAMVGDDINDLSVMNRIGLSACPSDSVNEVKSVCDVILRKKGGAGCVREFIDDYISHKKN